MQIIKASGEKEAYQKSKFCKSLKRAGASPDLVKKICERVEKELKPGMSTSALFGKTSKYLAQENPGVAVRYNLKKGMMELGPAGFFFEQYVETILRSYGYETKRNQIMKGRCVSHEIDVVAHKGNTHFLVEVKYHNRRGLKTDITVAMYADARLLDITPAQERKEFRRNPHKVWLITNTKFTTTAIRYGKCKNVVMTGWNYPRGESLEDLIEKNKLYPVTALYSVGTFEREQFAKRNMMLVRDILPYSALGLAEKIGVDKTRAGRIVHEAASCIKEEGE